MIVNIYSRMKSNVRTEGASTEAINLRMGPPFLFSIYINDIEDYFDKIDDAGITIEGRKIYVLNYAENLVLIAKQKLTVNTSKKR